MKNLKKEKRAVGLAIAAVLFIYLLQLGKILNIQFFWQVDFILAFLVNVFFIGVLIVSLIRLSKRQFSPLLIQAGGVMVILAFLYLTNQVTDTEKNYHIYKEGREEVIQLVLDGKITKDPKQYGKVGAFIAPPGFLDELWNSRFLGKRFSEEKYFFFFEIYTQPLSSVFGNGDGVIEGFLYSSLDRPPTPEEYNTFGRLEHIEGPWYYVNNEIENFEKDCPTLCD